MISIVINNFNYARFLPRSIESALGQSYERVEVIVADDASTDGSQEVIGQYAGRVKAVLLEKNGGQAAVMNAGYRACVGDIVVFLDADDWLHAWAAERIASACKPGVSKVQYRLDLVDVEGREIDLYPPPEVRFDSGNVIPRLLARGRYETAVTSGNAFPRATLEAILPIPEEDFRIAADGYLVTVAPFHGPVVSIEEPLGAYRQHGANLWAVDKTTLVPSALAESLGRSLEHDLQKFRVLGQAAHTAGWRLSGFPGLRDHQHLEARLASLVLSPARHLFPGDSRFVLGLRGAVAAAGARLPWKRRLIIAAWSLAVGTLPRAWAGRLVTWRLVQASRPPWADRLLKALRRASS